MPTGARVSAAAARADELLRGWLDPEQLRQLDDYGGFLVRGSKGGRYAIFPRWQDAVWQLYGPERGPLTRRRLVRGYGPVYAGLPNSDMALATMLAIQTDEGDLGERACVLSPESDTSRFAHEWAMVRRMEAEASPGGRAVRAIASMGRAFSPYPF
jgi:hypothetical protein